MQSEKASDVQESLGRNLTHGLLDALGRAIVAGKFVDKSFPSEADLIKEHGVSRSVTREAIKMLTAKGLVGARPKQGTFVLPQESWSLFDPDVLRWLLDRKLSYDLLRHFNELRIAVEPQAAFLAALRATPDHRAAISAGLDRMTAADRGEDETLDADIAFHVAILRASDNPFFIQFRELVSTALRTSIRFTNRLAGRPASLAEHAAVYDAIEARDPEAASAAMRKLIGNVLTLFEEQEAR